MKSIKKKERNIFYEKMIQLGYDDVTDFHRQSKIPVSFETCRRAIYMNSQSIEKEHIVIIMQTLDFTPQEIAEELKKRGDKNIYKLVSESPKGMILTSQEKRLIDLLRKKAQPRFVTLLTEMLILNEDVK